MQLMEAFIFLIRISIGFYITILLLRLLFQWARADFYNPVSQAIVKLTSPLVIPLRQLIPAMGRIDSASLLLSVVFQALLVAVVFLLRSYPLTAFDVILWSILGIVHRLLDIFTVALFIVVIVSWVAPYSRAPVALLATQLTEPLLKPIRGIIPPIAGLDFTVMIVFVLLYMIANFIIPGVPI